MTRPPSTHRGAEPRVPSVEIHRAYEDPPSSGGRVVLVDRLWPRGVSKEKAWWDEWLKAVAPSTELRRWYGHDVERFEEFVRKYHDELDSPPAAVALEHLEELAGAGTLTLVTATHDVEHSAAQVLHDELLTRS